MAETIIVPAERDNQVRMVDTTKPVGTSAEYCLINADQVLVGVANPEVQVIASDNRGFKYATDCVDPVEIFNISKQSHGAWLMLDLETGGRGWYPGSKEVVDVRTAIVYESANDSSTQIAQLENATVDKLDLVYGPSSETTANIIYCQIQTPDYTGFIKNKTVTTTRFVDRS